MLAACVALVKRSVAENHILTSATHAGAHPASFLGRAHLPPTS